MLDVTLDKSTSATQWSSDGYLRLGIQDFKQQKGSTSYLKLMGESSFYKNDKVLVK